MSVSTTSSRDDAKLGVITWDAPAKIARRATVIVLPGRGESPSVYERFGARLAVDAYQVHAVRPPTTDEESTRRQVSELLEAADRQVPTVVVGSDAGAAFAAYLAAAGDLKRVDALVLAGLPADRHATATADWSKELDLRTACPTHQSYITSDIVRPADLFSELPEIWFDAQPEKITVPVLGIHGSDDEISPLSQIRAWYQSLPTGELVTVRDGRHDALNDATHRSVAATVVLFLERLRQGTDLTSIVTTEVKTLHKNGSRQ